MGFFWYRGVGRRRSIVRVRGCFTTLPMALYSIRVQMRPSRVLGCVCTTVLAKPLVVVWPMMEPSASFSISHWQLPRILVHTCPKV